MTGFDPRSWTDASAWKRSPCKNRLKVQALRLSEFCDWADITVRHHTLENGKSPSPGTINLLLQFSFKLSSSAFGLDPQRLLPSTVIPGPIVVDRLIFLR